MAATSEIDNKVRELKVLLKIPVSAYFARDQYIIPVLNKMEDAGVISIGDFINQKESELFANFRTSRSNQLKIKTFVKNFGLSFAP